MFSLSPTRRSQGVAAEDVTEDLAELEILDFQEEGTKLSTGSASFCLSQLRYYRFDEP